MRKGMGAGNLIGFEKLLIAGTGEATHGGIVSDVNDGSSSASVDQVHTISCLLHLYPYEGM